LPDDGGIHREELANSFKDGEKAITMSLKELIEHGYIHKVQKRDSSNRFAGVQYVIHEIPEIDKSIDEAARLARETKAIAEEEAFQQALARGLEMWNSMNIEDKKVIFKKVHKQYSFIDANFDSASGAISDSWLRDLICHKLGKE
jgi:predicted Zn-dependent protease